MRLRTILSLSLMLGTASCAAVQPVSPGAPSRNQPLYPVLLTEAPTRIDAANAVWLQITSHQGISGKTQAPLQPITSTIRSLPENFGGPLYLPKVGAGTQMSEEETRESLRRLDRVSSNSRKYLRFAPTSFRRFMSRNCGTCMTVFRLFQLPRFANESRQN